MRHADDTVRTSTDELVGRAELSQNRRTAEPQNLLSF